MIQTARHYTIGDRAEGILSSGIIRPATAFVPATERPVVWFSTRQHWEPTATKILMLPNGRTRRMTFAEMLERGDGAWRFGVPTTRLLAWQELQRAANISRETARNLAHGAANRTFTNIKHLTSGGLSHSGRFAALIRSDAMRQIGDLRGNVSALTFIQMTAA